MTPTTPTGGEWECIYIIITIIIVIYYYDEIWLVNTSFTRSSLNIYNSVNPDSTTVFTLLYFVSTPQSKNHYNFGVRTKYIEKEI